MMYKQAAGLNQVSQENKPVLGRGCKVYKEGKIGVTVGCSGSRNYTKIADEEMIMGIPVELWLMLPQVSKQSALHKPESISPSYKIIHAQPFQMFPGKKPVEGYCFFRS